MKINILTILAATMGLAAYAQTETNKIADNTTVIVIVENNYSDNDKAEKEKKEKEEKDKKDKEEREKKDK